MAFPNRWRPYWDVAWHKMPKRYSHERGYTGPIYALSFYLGYSKTMDCYDSFMGDRELKDERRQALLDLCGPHGTTLLKMKLINLGVYKDFSEWPE